MSKHLKKLFIGGNWKSNNTLQQTKDLVEKVVNNLKFDDKKVDVVVAPVFVHLPWVLESITNKVQVAAQNTSKTAFGAYTGEIAPQQIKDLGINWAILGHSERRQYYGETDEVVATKTKLAISTSLNIVLCIGETLQERESGKTMSILERQLTEVKSKGQLTKEDWLKVVVAYEPVWAIGTGKVASTEQAEEVHKHIRGWLDAEVSKEISDATRIIYGGSVTEKNSTDLMKQKNIDGFLVGGASLKSSFSDIVDSTKVKL